MKRTPPESLCNTSLRAAALTRKARRHLLTVGPAPTYRWAKWVPRKALEDDATILQRLSERWIAHLPDRAKAAATGGWRISLSDTPHTEHLSNPQGRTGAWVCFTVVPE